MVNIIAFVATLRRLASYDLVRLALPGVKLREVGLSDLNGMSYLDEVRDALIDFVEEYGRLPGPIEAYEIPKEPMSTRSDAQVWVLFVGLGGWLHGTAADKLLTTEGASDVLTAIGRRLVRELLATAERV